MANRPIRVVLVRPRNPVNIGACARAMANFGLVDLVVVDPYEPVWQETRSAPGAEKIVLEARAAATWEEALAGCSVILGTSSFHQRPFEHAVLELPNLNRHLSSFPAAEPLALVFGSERSGLSNEELSCCQAIVHIPTRREAPSMNLGQAVAIVLYELGRSAWEKPSKGTSPPPQDLEKMIAALAELGAQANYPAGYEAPARLGRIRQAFQDTSFSAAAVHFLLSFFRWLRKKQLVK